MAGGTFCTHGREDGEKNLLFAHNNNKITLIQRERTLLYTGREVVEDLAFGSP